MSIGSRTCYCTLSGRPTSGLTRNKIAQLNPHCMHIYKDHVWTYRPDAGSPCEITSRLGTQRATLCHHPNPATTCFRVHLAQSHSLTAPSAAHHDRLLPRQDHLHLVRRIKSPSTHAHLCTVSLIDNTQPGGFTLTATPPWCHHRPPGNAQRAPRTSHAALARTQRRVQRGKTDALQPV